MEASAVEIVRILGTGGVDFGGVWQIGRLVVGQSHEQGEERKGRHIH